MPVEALENDVGEFLAVFAGLLLDNVMSLDETFGVVTDFVMASKPDRNTVVNLQAFDRLKQEFEALGEAMSRYAKAHNEAPLSPDGHAQLTQDVIAGITVQDLKERWLVRLRDNLPDLPLPVISPEQAAEIGIDIVY